MNIHFHCKVRDSRNISPFILHFYLQFDLRIFYSRRGTILAPITVYQTWNCLKFFTPYVTIGNIPQKLICADQPQYTTNSGCNNPIMLSRQSFAKQLPISPIDSTLIINFFIPCFQCSSSGCAEHDPSEQPLFFLTSLHSAIAPVQTPGPCVCACAEI